MNISLPGGKRDLIKKSGTAIFIAVAVASVILAFAIVAINIMWDQASYNSKVQSEKETARDNLLNNITVAEALKTDLAALETSDDLIAGQGDKTNTGVILDALPRRYDFPALRTSVDKLAELSGVRLTSFSGSDRESEAIASMIQPVPQEVPFSVSVEGTYSSILDFIANMERTIRPMKVVQVRLAGSDESMSASFDVVTYYQPSVNLDVETRTIQ